MPGWGPKVRRRADRDHARKKAARRQKQHLRAIKSDAELRAIVLGSRHKSTIPSKKGCDDARAG